MAAARRVSRHPRQCRKSSDNTSHGRASLDERGVEWVRSQTAQEEQALHGGQSEQSLAGQAAQDAHNFRGNPTSFIDVPVHNDILLEFSFHSAVVNVLLPPRNIPLHGALLAPSSLPLQGAILAPSSLPVPVAIPGPSGLEFQIALPAPGNLSDPVARPGPSGLEFPIELFVLRLLKTPSILFGIRLIHLQVQPPAHQVQREMQTWVEHAFEVAVDGKEQQGVSGGEKRNWKRESPTSAPNGFLCFSDILNNSTGSPAADEAPDPK
ncbi:hypothetical protein BDK51DRAFT_40465 [Blyttiomyces helicus]|uniref:Uncharacterized protein n=1 Tax=Blyttiomyces helicus TaxID=388810 RepID=A0A4P9WA82_9FUNG|nr:hypothetical protein BDK51DRAFT_40465 [Blyttiomyces helicus]|eukprot:RKO89491.1 hypothetical protein BDK51DRAFT_40465 [Blyttiomyces helicus]